MAFLSTSTALLLFLTSSSSRSARQSLRLFSSSSSSSSSSCSIIYNENQLISSTKSTTVKTFQNLLSKRKHREQLQATIVEGPKMIFDLLRSDQTRHLVQQILVSTDVWDDSVRRLEEVLELSTKDDFLQSKSGSSLQILPATPQVLRACSDVVTPQGMVAKVAIPQQQRSMLSSSKLQQESSSSSRFPRALYVILDGLQDPGNVGTLIRSCVAANVAGLITLPLTSDPWAPKAVRSAMATSFQMPIYAASSWKECCDLLAKDFSCQRILAATMLDNHDNDDNYVPPKSTCYFNVDYMTEPTAIVLGSEGSGLSDDVISDLLASTTSDGLQRQQRLEAVHIPMAAGVESLNAAVCGSVILYEYVRQRTVQERINNKA